MQASRLEGQHVTIGKDITKCTQRKAMSGMGASPPQLPPWLQEPAAKYQKTQQELQSIAMQKQHLESERANTEHTLKELKKAEDDEKVFKFAGSVLIKTTKAEMISELNERQEIAKTRAIVVGKQEARLLESLKAQEAKITEMMRSRGTRGTAASTASAAASSPSPPRA